MCTYINIYSFLILSTQRHHPKIISSFSFFSFHCHPQTYVMTMSSKMNCGAIHASSCIAKWHHALSDTTNKKSPAVLKKKCSGTSKNKKKGGGGPKPPLLLHPKTLTQLSIKVDCCFFYVSCLFVLTLFYLIVVFVP